MLFSRNRVKHPSWTQSRIRSSRSLCWRETPAFRAGGRGFNSSREHSESTLCQRRGTAPLRSQYLSPVYRCRFLLWRGRRDGAFLQPARHRANSPHRSVSLPATPRYGDRRVEALLRQDLAGSNPVGGSSIENIPDKGSTRVLSTPGPASTVFRSPVFITWPTSWSRTLPQEPEIRVQIPASYRAKARQGSEDACVFRRWNLIAPPWCNLGARCCGSSSVIEHAEASMQVIDEIQAVEPA